MPHLLINEPEDDSYVDPDFLTEAIERFPEDDTVRDALVGAVEELSRQLAVMNMNNDYKPYILVRYVGTRNLKRVAKLSIGVTEARRIPRNR